MSIERRVPIPEQFPRLLDFAPEVMDEAQRLFESVSALRGAMPRPFSQDTSQVFEVVDEVAQRLMLRLHRPVDPGLAQCAGHTIAGLSVVLRTTSEWAQEVPEFDTPEARTFLASIAQTATTLIEIWRHMTFYELDEAPTVSE